MDPKDPKVIDIINKIAKEHSGPKKRFGYFTSEDLFNEIWVICLEQLSQFDGTRGDLERFLRVTVKNRLINKYKEITKIVRSPCPRCPFYAPGKAPSDCKKFGDDRHKCDKWAEYQLLKDSRNALLNPTDVKTDRSLDYDIGNFVIGTEIKEYILRNVENKYKRDFEQFMQSGYLSKNKLHRLYRVVKEMIFKFEKEKKITKLTIKGV